MRGVSGVAFTGCWFLLTTGKFVCFSLLKFAHRSLSSCPFFIALFLTAWKACPYLQAQTINFEFAADIFQAKTFQNLYNYDHAPHLIPQSKTFFLYSVTGFNFALPQSTIDIDHFYALSCSFLSKVSSSFYGITDFMFVVFSFFFTAEKFVSLVR